MSAGRPRLMYLRANWKLSLPAGLAAEVDLLLEDPLSRKPRYGARSRLVEALLREYLARARNETLPTVPSLNDLRQGA